MDPAELALAFSHPDRPCYPPAPTAFRRKIAVLAERRRIVTGAGMVLPMVATIGVLALWGGETLEADVGLVAAELSSLTATAPAGASSGMVVVAGWEEGVGAAAYALASGSAWRPLRLGTGYAYSPVPHPSIEGYEDLAGRIMSPPGDDVADVLEALARNQAEAARRGFYRAAPAIAGALYLAEVDAAGARQRVIGQL